MMTPDAIALIGFGEVGQHLAKDFYAAGVAKVTAWDIAFADRGASSQRKAAEALGVVAGASSAEALRGASVVFSAVTAASDVEAASAAARAIEPGAFYADLNSVSPATKVQVARIMEAAGARFVEVAVMSPIAPRGIRSPMLLGGRHAAAFIEGMRAFGPDMTAVSATIGQAAATKMCRSVMYKGLEALFLESMLAARHYGVEEAVLASLAGTFDKGWRETARYMISRTLVHGRRRAEEMREAANTVAEAGLAPLVTERVAAREDWAADENASGKLAGLALDTASLGELLDRLVLEHLHPCSRNDPAS
jgi:3-hydroxyisobutyrate dehydrogenase